MSATAPHQKVLDGWTLHNGTARVNTELTVLNLLHQHYPGHHITTTDPTSCNLLSFAAAGHATATPDHDLGYISTRFYQAPHYRHKRGEGEGESGGVLKNDVTFGRWSYVWNDHHHLVYLLKYTATYCNKTVLYVLTPLTEDERTMLGAHHPVTDELLRAAGAWSKELHGDIYVYDNSSWDKDAELWASVQNASWDDVIMDGATKESIRRDALGFFDNEDLYKSLSVPWKRGLILHGVPGNGKTMTVKALIRSLAERPEPIPALLVKSLDSSNGSKWSIAQIFDHARRMAPCVLIFEDLDSLVGNKTRSYFLNEVDGLDDNNGILMIGSTNHLNRLDSAITKRPSRFDRKYHFRVPDESERGAYCEYWRGKVSKLPHDFDFPTELCPLVAKMTEGFSFAYLKELFMSVMLLVATGSHLENEHDEEDPALENSSTESAKSDTESAVVVESAAAAAPSGPAEAKESKKNTKADAKKKKKRNEPKKLPEVQVPESLRDNTMLRIIRSQAKTLLADMDNTESRAGMPSLPPPGMMFPGGRVPLPRRRRAVEDSDDESESVDESDCESDD